MRTPSVKSSIFPANTRRRRTGINTPGYEWRSWLRLTRSARGSRIREAFAPGTSSRWPAIRGPSYEVGPDVAGLFPETFAIPSGDPAAGRAQLDLPSCALAQAAGARVPRENLVDFSLDTFTRPGDLFSHRRGDRGRHWAFVGRP